MVRNAAGFPLTTAFSTVAGGHDICNTYITVACDTQDSV